MKNFFNPKTIAIVGASDDPEKVGNSLIKNLINFEGKIVPINIKHDKVAGLKAYQKISDYPGKIDLVVIAIPSPFVPPIIEECGRKKIKNVIVISAGFSEVGNIGAEKNLIKIAQKYKINLLGPNCFGICNPYNNLDTTFSLQTPNKGNTAFISQSGALWSYISDFSIGRFGFSGFVSLGNMAGVDFSDFISYFSRDKNTNSIVLYIEKLKDGRRFIEICRKTKKKIFAVKAGFSEKGQKAAISHTGSLATDFAIYKGAFKQANVTLCDSLVECFEKATGRKLIEKAKKIKIGKKAVIITNAGGAGALMADYCEKSKIDVVNWKEKNPMDLIGTALAEDYKNALDKLKGDFYDTVIVILTPQRMSEIEKTAEAVIDFSKRISKKVIACFLGGQSVLKAKEMFEKNNIIFFNTLEGFKKSLP